MLSKKGPKEKFYLGNTNLPTAQTEYDYTPAMIKEIAKCRKNIIHFASNYFFIINVDEGRQKIKLHTFQKRILKGLMENRFNILLASRQIGKTTLMTIYALWVALFEEDQRILIVANKEQTAKMILKRIKTAFEMMPNFIKSGAVEYGQTNISLSNGSSIGISTTSSDAGRGESVNCVSGDSIVTIRDKSNGNILDISMEELSKLLEKNGEIKTYLIED